MSKTMHLQWQEILTYHSVRQYEHSHRLEFTITVLHFGLRGSSLCYTCIIAVWLDPVIQSSNPVHQSSPQSTPAIRDGLCKQLLGGWKWISCSMWSLSIFVISSQNNFSICIIRSIHLIKPLCLNSCFLQFSGTQAFLITIRNPPLQLWID